MADRFELWDRNGAVGDLFLVLVVVGIAYVVLIAPVRLLSGSADSRRMAVAGFVGMWFWILVAYAIVAMV